MTEAITAANRLTGRGAADDSIETKTGDQQ